MDWSSGPDAGRRATTGAGPESPQGDATAGTFDVEEYRGLLRAAEEVLDSVDRALVQLDDGTYGACTVCGEPIDEGRLELDPTAQRCGRHDAPDGGTHDAPDGGTHDAPDGGTRDAPTAPPGGD